MTHGGKEKFNLDHIVQACHSQNVKPEMFHCMTQVLQTITSPTICISYRKSRSYIKCYILNGQSPTENKVNIQLCLMLLAFNTTEHFFAGGILNLCPFQLFYVA